ncbi:MAG: tetratricopeptide repeat protein [Alphaproteobacteria bacterium]|jgi:tetratricopeptide (TPR) repeat protein|nr:tetratricopeptide repeat protein [Alphaproteobacteria bacterium]
MAQRPTRVAGGAMLAAMLLVGVLWPAPGAGGQNASPADRQWTFAVRLVQQGEADLAVDAFGDFLRHYPSDDRADDAHYYLAVLAERQGRLDDALKQLAQVKRPAYVTPAAVYLLHGQVRLRRGEAKAALGELARIKAGDLDDSATRASWHYLLGVCYRKLDNVQAAEAQFDKATEADSPVKGRALLELGKTRLMLDRPNAATEAFGEVIGAEQDVDSAAVAEARSLAADLAQQRGQYERAADLYNRIIEQHQNSEHFGSALVGLLRSLYAAAEYEQVLDRYAALARLLPAEAIGQALYLKAAAAAQLERYDAALASLEQYRRRTRPDHALRRDAAELAGLCLYHADPDAFTQWYAQNQPRSRRMRYLRALVAARQDQPRQAIRLFDGLVEPADSAYAAAALLRRARLHERIGQARQAADDLAAFAQRYPDRPQAETARRRAVGLAFETKQFQRVVDLGEGLAGDPALLLRRALAHLKLDHADRASRLLDELLHSDPGERLAALGRFYRGMIRAADDEDGPANERAVADLDAALAGPLPDAQQTAALTTLARLHRAAGREDRALAAYERLRAARDDADFDPATALWVGRGLVEADRAKAALDWLDTALGSGELDQARRAQAMYFKARALHELERYAEAIQTYRKMLAFTTPRAYGYQGRLGLAQAYAASSDLESAMEEYNGLVSAPGSRVAATALHESAMLHLEQARRFERGGLSQAATEQRREARRRLQRILILYDLRELDPLPLRARLVLGRMAIAAGRDAEARQRFEHVAGREAYPVWGAIAEAELQAVNEPTAARQVFEKLAREHKDTQAGRYAERRARGEVAP